MTHTGSDPELPWALALLVRLHPSGDGSTGRRVLVSLVGDVWKAARSRSRLHRGTLAARLALDLIWGALLERARRFAPRPGRGRRRVEGASPRAGRMDSLVQDVRAAFRGFRREPVFAAASVGTLALGIAGVTTFWSVCYGVLLKPLPYPEAERIVRVWDNARALQPRGSIHFAVSAPEYLAWLDQSRTIEDAAAVALQYRNMEGGEFPLRVRTGSVTSNFFAFLGAEPFLGRGFRPGENDPGADPVAVLSHALWRSEFGSDPAVLGRTVRLDGIPHEIVGVAPPDFEWLDNPEFNSAQPDPLALWTPRSMDRADTGGYLQVVARTRADVSTEEVAQDLGTLRARFSPSLQDEVELPEPSSLVTVERLHDALYTSVQDRVVLPLAAVTLLMLLACANVAHLLLGRLPRRSGELSTRAALGATRGRLARQLMTEALVLATLGAIVGAAVATVATRAVARLGPQEISRLSDVHVDASALALSIVCAAISAVLFGLVPAIRGAFPGVGRSRHREARGRSILLSGQLALALVLLSSATLVARSFSRLLATDLGVDSTGVVEGYTQLLPEGYVEDLGTDVEGLRVTSLLESWVDLGKNLIERLSGDPRVTDVGIAMYLESGWSRGRLRLEEDAPDAPGEPSDSSFRFASQTVGPGYFGAMGVPVIRGRDFVFDDAGVAVVNESLARIYWPGEDPVGKRIWSSRPTFDGTTLRPSPPLLVEVVGVVPDWRERGYGEGVRPTLFSPLRDALGPGRALRPPPLGIVVRASSPTRETQQLMMRAVRDLDPRAVVSNPGPMEVRLGEALGAPRFFAFLFAAFGMLALAVAVAGTFGTVASSVSERTREIGVRMALGGRATDVVKTVVHRAAVYSVIGVTLGIVGSLFASRLIRGLLYDAESSDPASLGMAVAVLLVSAITAAWLPAREAVRIDPATTLRAE